MENMYLIVNKKVLPDFFEKVVEARNLIEHGIVKEVSEAVKIAGISRSTYYKYKDYVYTPNVKDLFCKKAVISMMISHEQGLLADVLKKFSDNGANILTIVQNLPINGKANVVISAEMNKLTVSIETLIQIIGEVKGVHKPKLIAIE